MKKLNPYFVTGFVEGEGSFYVGIFKRKQMNIRWEVRPSFSLSQNKSDRDLVCLLVSFFQCGNVRESENDNTVKYEVRSLEDITKKVIPHFERYKLMGRKKRDFEIFKEIIVLMNKKRHFRKDGLSKIVKLSLEMTKNPRRIKSLKKITTFLKV